MRPEQQYHFGTQTAGARQGVSDASEFLWKTYRWMSLGLAATGIVAWMVASSPALLSALLGNKILFYGLLLGELALVFTISARVHRMTAQGAAAMFLLYAALNGVTFSFIFAIYTQSSIAQTFFVTAGAFGGLSFVGATTKKDLSAMGSFMYMGLFGLIIASVVNIFLQSSAVYWISTYAGVVIFAGLTAWDTQKLKTMYAQRGEAGNLAIHGALMLYLDFINLFLMLLRVLGDRR